MEAHRIHWGVCTRMCYKLRFVFKQEMTNREHEYIALSRDTTEADLKQRREIKGGTAYYVDQVCW